MNFHHRVRNELLYADEVFENLPLEKLVLSEPRTGCAARAQIITEWLRAAGLVAGRIWALPPPGQKYFDVPLCDSGHKYFEAIDTGARRLVWAYHVAATVVTENGIAVLDPVVFDGPVPACLWTNLFAGEGARTVALKYYEAPLYGYAGSCYSPELQQEHGPDENIMAQLDMQDISNMQTVPGYARPDYRPRRAPRMASWPLVKKQ